MNIFFRKLILSITLVVALSGCASVVTSLTAQLAEDLSWSILNSNDVETVREAIPAYLVMLDSFLRGSPEDPKLLMAASSLNGAFAIFTDENRAKLLTTKSLNYALVAACVTKQSLCGLQSMKFDALQVEVDLLEEKDVPVTYTVAVAWTSWIQANSDDWNAIAQLSKVKYLMNRVIELDETWDNGGPHLYMGGLETVLPASMGGDPEVGRAHFERAIELGESKFLMTKVVFAENYAKLTFNKSLHDQLLKEVIDADPIVDGMTLTNTVALQKAAVLLAESDDYF
jgi:hypothetical protein